MTTCLSNFNQQSIKLNLIRLRNTIALCDIRFFPDQNYNLSGDRIITAKQVVPIQAKNSAKSQHAKQKHTYINHNFNKMTT